MTGDVPGVILVVGRGQSIRVQAPGPSSGIYLDRCLLRLPKLKRGI